MAAYSLDRERLLAYLAGQWLSRMVSLNPRYAKTKTVIEMQVPPTNVIWHDGELVPWRSASVHMLNQTLQYGWGVYEGIRVYRTAAGPAAFRLDAHLRRMSRSAAMYGMRLGWTGAELSSAVGELVRANGLSAAYVRPLAVGPDGEIGVDPTEQPLRVMIAVWPMENFLGAEAARDGISACVSSWTRVPASALPLGSKVCAAYTMSMLARAEAARQGCTEAILLNAAGTVADACVENVFVVSGGQLMTPPLCDGPLPGITRDTIMTLARDADVPFAECHLTRADLYTADEIFLTGTAAEVVPVVQLDGRRVADGVPGPVTLALMGAFRNVVSGTDGRYSDWLEPTGEMAGDRAG
jgi:branched-chain amino acid aminotransferase